MTAAIKRAGSCLACQVREPTSRVVIPPSLCYPSAQNEAICIPRAPAVGTAAIRPESAIRVSGRERRGDLA
jgi:hypothetical protein